MRYSRQTQMKEIGQRGQQMLREAEVAVIGAGGLGSQVLTNLACAGVGSIRLAEYDTVSESNLNRQFFYSTADIGRPKAEIAKQRILALNPQCNVALFTQKINEGNAAAFVRGAAVVVDCVDNIKTRLIAGDAVLKEDTTLVEAGIDGFYGYVTVIRRDTACLRCLGFHENTKIKTPISSLGATVSVIGAMQANQALKILLGIEDVLLGKMLNYDGLSDEVSVITLQKSERCSCYML